MAGLAEFFEKAAAKTAIAQKEMEMVVKDNKARTIIFHWHNMMARTAAEASRLASQTPDETGKWEGVKATELRVCLAKMNDIFRS